VAKSNKKTLERRAVVEQMRREQQRAEKRRNIILAVVFVAVAGVIVGLGAIPLIKQQQAASGALGDLGVSASAAGCQPVRTKSAVGNNDHRSIGSNIFYPDAPPAFGPHYPTPAPFSRKFYTTEDRPKVEYLVHNLEHGYTLLWYDQSIADNTDKRNVIRGIAEKFQAGGTDMRDKFIAAPWTAADGKPFPKGTHLALTHWSMGGTHGNPKGQHGVWEYCGQPSGAVVSSFMHDYPYTDSPEPTAM
jgi:hypothetical protein